SQSPRSNTSMRATIRCLPGSSPSSMPARRAAAEPSSLRHQVHNPDEVLVAVSFAIINDTVHCRSQVRHIKEASLCGAVRRVAVPSEQQVGFFVGGIGEVGAGQARDIYAAV